MRAGAEGVSHRARRGARVLVVLTCLLFAAGGLLAGRVLFGPSTWAPLGPYPVQQVVAPVVDGVPTVPLSAGVVKVHGRKCEDGDGYAVVGSASWQSLDPRGTIIRAGEGSRPAADGCTSFTFANTIPETVAEAVHAQARTGVDRPVWRLVGTERPVDGERTGAELTWATEPFVLVDDD